MHFSLAGLITNGWIRRLKSEGPLGPSLSRRVWGGSPPRRFFENIVNFVHSGAYLTRLFGQN